MAKYVSGRQKNLKVGIASYSENLTSLEVIGAATFTGESSGELVRISQIGTGPAFVVEDSANPDTTPFAVTTDGRVAIGVAVGGISSSYKLEVDGNGNGGGVRFVSGGQGDLIFSHSNLVSNVRAAGDVQLGLGANDGDAIRINLDNNVGLGSTNPTSKLYVVGDGYFTGVVTSSNFYVGNSLIGGGSSFSQLYVSGISTLGVTSATNLTSQQLNVSGITTLGVVTSGNIYSTGVITATTFSGNASSATYASNAGIATYATNAGIATYATYATNAGIATYASNAGIATYASNAGIATYATNAGVATALQYSRTFEITGDIVASPISFNGTGNVSLAATIQPNSVALGGDTTGDYVQSITGTSNQITVTSGTGEGSTPTLSIPNQFTAPQDVTVTRDLQVNRNLNVTGNITIGGTSATIFSQSLTISDPDIVLGYRTDAFGNDVSNDNTANHGGVAIASTEGSPLVQLFIAGIETNPATYKKIMWFKAGTFAGLGTDAWLSNYAVGIGSTQFPTGTRLAAGSVQFTQNDLAVVRNINASGIVTAPTLSGTTVTYTTGNFATGNIVTGIVTTLSGTNLNYTGISTLGVTSATNLTAQQLNVSGLSTFTGAVSFGTSAYFGDNDTLNFGDGNDLQIYHDGSNSYVADYGTGRLVLTSNGAGVDIVKAPLEYTARFLTDGAVELYYDNTKEFETTGYGATVFGILESQGLQVSGASTFSGITTHTTPLFGTQASFTGVVTASSFSGNASSATYATTAGVSTSVSGGTASVTQLNVSLSGITTVGFITATDIWNAGITTSSRLTLNGANSTTTGEGQIYLNGASGNRIDFNTNGAAAPTFTTRSAGTKIVLYPSVGASKVDYAFGINANVLWSSVEDSGSQFKWYAGTTQLADLKGSGELVIGSSTLTGTAAQRLQVSGGAYVSGSVGIGTTNPSSTLDVRSSTATIRVQDTTNNYSVALNPTTGPRVSFGIGGNDSFMEFGAYAGINNLDTKARDLRIFSSAAPNAFTLQQSTGNIGINSTTPTSKLDVVGDVKVIGVVTATSFSGNASSATYATNAGIATHIKGGLAGNILYQSAPDTTVFLTNGASGTILQSNGVGNAPSWINAAPSNALTGLTIRDEGTIVGSANSVTQLNFVGAIVSAASTAGIATITFLDYVSNAGIATYATNAGVSTNIKGGVVGNIPYQSAPDTTVFLTNGSSGTILQSNGVGNAPTWVTPAPAGAITGLTIRDEGTVVGGANSVSQLNFVGAIVSAASTAGIATITFLDYVSNAGTSTSVSGGIASVTQLNVTGVTTVGFITASNLNVSGVGTFLSSGLKIRNPANTFQYNITGGAIAADRILNLPVIATTDTVAVLGLSQTFGAQQNFNDTISAIGTLSLTGSTTGTHVFGTNQTSGTLTFGGTSGTGAITLGRATTSQTTNIQAGVTASGNTKTINFGIGGASGSFTQINVGSTAGVGTVTINAGTNLGINSTTPTSKLDVIGNVKVIGVVTATSFSGNASSATYATSAGIATYATTAGVATALQNSRTFEITGDIVASPISFNGTGNVSLAATIQPNSVALGSDTTGDYVSNITGTSNQITVTSGTGEGSTPTLSIPSQFTAPQDVTVTRDLQVNRNLNVTGNITIGGTSATIFSQSLTITDPDIILGFRTDAFGNDVSNDNTANHGGIAVASTEGTPLVNLFIAGIETNPATYKKIMWFKEGTFAGLGTDAWLSNYAVGIGSTQFPTGTRLAAGSVQFTENDLAVVRNINASGVVTATSFSGNASSATYATSSGIATYATSSGIATYATNAGIATYATSSGIATYATSSGIATYATSSGIATYATNAGIATYATSAGIATYSTNAGIATYATSAGIATYSTNAGIATYATSAGVSTSVIGGIGSITQLQVTGVSTFTNGPVLVGSATSTGTASQRLQVTGGAYVSDSVGIGTTYSTYELDVIGRVRATNDIDLVSTTGSLNITGRPNLASGGNYPVINIEYPSGGSLYSLYAWQDTGNDRVYQQLANSTDYFTALDSDSEFIIGLKGAGLLGGSTYSFKIDIDAETSLYYNQTEKLTTTNQGILVTGLTSTTTLNVGTGGTVITTTASGLVGIGTTNPRSTLDVRGAINVGDAVSITAETDSGNNDVIYFNPLNESRVSIGINTTLNWSSISNLPDVAFVADKSILGLPKIAIADPTSTSPLYQLYSAYSNSPFVPFGYVRQELSNASYAIAIDSGVFSVGNSSSLDSSSISNFTPGEEAFIVTLGGSTSLFHSKSKKFETSGVGVTVYGNLNVGTGGTVITTTASGLVGIGTTNPLGTLQVGTGITMYGATGIISATSYRGDGSQLSGISAGLTVADDTSTNATRYILFDDATSGTISAINVSSTKLTFNPSTGNMVVGGTVTANSDEKLKTNIKTIDNALDKVLSLRGVEYDRIDTGDHQIGVIAQEVEKIIPDVVYPKQPAPDYETKSVAYANLVGLLIEAIKEQNVRIEELERKLEEK
jgi:hypothetical protein